MSNAYFKIKKPYNEPIYSYLPGSKERTDLKDKIKELKSKEIEIPLIIGGKEVRTGKVNKCIVPHDKEHVLATYHMAGEKEVNMAIESALNAKREWDNMPWEHRVSIFLKAAELLSGPWRSTLNAATMLAQSKTVFQAEIDAACELIDFLRFNCYYLTQIYNDQPYSSKGVWNRVEYRPLEGFVFAVTPFNFTSIGGNLPTAPALVGNTVLWKPASNAVYSNYFFMKLLQAAGLPDGVINFMPGYGSEIGEYVLKSEYLAGIHFTGSTKVFRGMWKTVGENIDKYRMYPRIVGETGGKDFIFAHKSADIDSLVTAIVRGAFEYQGQKCSAASRAYIPESIWPDVKQKLLKEISTIKMGDVEDFSNFIGAVIDENAFNKIKSYIEYAKSSNEADVIYGGKCNNNKGYFIEPTVIVTNNSKFKTMKEEIFGPVITIYVYNDNNLEETLELCNSTSPYALTGAIFSQDRRITVKMQKALTHSAGNFYINDKPTGAVVGQQPFGGSRASGTNDKAGSMFNLLRWISPRAIKENFNPPKKYEYNYMRES
ncbi:L-glutamate gamma-semialdehyde dehydrogenase [Caldisalinibacter kiritimatiensis]|uniref:L-glutamate gamma-semialdehyde dehydrogenase n=1 Tax=Caldisalinibacter kiritimatiensis TaxID=1304284 RepID=R1CHH0_9FIRM|nr:L-glutamate gamma-semialdehyde dehydrogenase [Caldisalinibacter kiritimatiensis]EOD01740.1 Delta-1-pyrroline-5-carboxylate dehydrogenase [Caldisalinibacter kiritimatiensis]